MRRQNILILPFGNCVGKLLAYFMCLFRAHFAGVKGLYQMVCKVIALVHSLREGKTKLNISRFMGTTIGGNQDFFISFGGIADIVKGFL